MSFFAAPVGLRRRWACCFFAACTFALSGASSAQVLIKEVVSREASIQVGGLQTPEIKEVVSLETSLYIENGPANPYSQVTSREVSLVVDTSETPPQVTDYVVTLSPTGDSVTLDWASYNPWAVQDVERFEIYISDSPFSDVSSLTPVKTVGGETVTATVGGLTPFQDHFIAIVAVDGLGNRNTAVINSAAYILSPQLISREVSLFVGQEPTPPYKEVVSREVSLAVATAAPPAQVTGYVVTPSPLGDSVALDWSNYNQWAEGDVARFDIYVSNQPFSSVDGLTPFQSSPGGSVSITLNGLPTQQDHYIAIVAVDTLGNSNPEVIYSAAYILAPQVISREVALFVGDETVPPFREAISREVSIIVPDATVPDSVTTNAATSTTLYQAIDLDWTAYNELVQQDVVRYRVYTDTNFFTNVTDLTPTLMVPAGTQKSVMVVPQGNQIYYTAVVAEDGNGNFDPSVIAVSAQSSVSAIWVPSNNSITYNGAVLANGATIRAAGTLQADATVATAVTKVDFFVRQSNGVNEILLGSDSTPEDGFTAYWDATTSADGAYIFTVRAFDSVGRSTEINRSVTLRFNYPPLISTLQFDGLNLAADPTIASSGKLGVLATDNDGIGSAEFFQQKVGTANRTSLGIDSTIVDGLNVALNLESLTDGAYDLTARVYDSVGFFSEITRRVNLALAVPGAPSIASPVSGESFQTATVQVQGSAQNSATLKIYRNNALVYTGAPSANGSFSASIDLVDGANALYAESTNRAGTGPKSNTVSITKVSVPPVLALNFQQSSLTEGGSLNGTISIDKTLSQAFIVSLGVTESGRLTFPTTITIPAGQTSSTFAVQAVQNQNVEGSVSVTLIASAGGSTAVIAPLQILDDDKPTIQFELNQTTVAENSGANAVQGTFTLNSAVGNALSTTFTASPTGQVTLPASLTIPANTTTISVPISIVNNSANDGNRTVTITANLVSSGGEILASRTVDLAITDDEAPSLSLAFDRSLLIEGRNPAGNGIVTRNAAGAALPVNLSSSKPAKLIVPASVTIAAGQSSATFPIQTINDNLSQGNETIQITSTATGLNPGVANIVISDAQKPDLAVGLVNPPQGAETDAYIDVPIILSNQGTTDARGPYTQRILLSSDNAIGDDTILGQADFTGILPTGATIQQSLRMKLPRTGGRFWLVVQTDANAAVDETLEDNNTAIAATPLDVAPAYSATLSIVPETLPTNTPIPITGSATLKGGGPAPFVLVNIFIDNAGIERTISALTNSAGQFSTTFTPLPNEGGLLQLAAAHPGADFASVQDEVRVYGLKADPSPISIILAESVEKTGALNLTNAVNLPISGLTVTTMDLPNGMVFTPTLPTTNLPESGAMTLTYKIFSSTPQTETTFNLKIRSTEGATLTVPITVSVVANKPVIVAEPRELLGGFLHGQQQFVTFDLRNEGQATTQPINVLLPANFSWMRLITPLPLPALAPGDATTVTLQLLPQADLPLEEYSGNLVATDGTSRTSIPFKLRALSDQTGSLVVRAEDEYTYYATGNPPLAEATVRVSDALTRELIATLVTDGTGRADFGALREGYYDIDVTADRHASFQTTKLVTAGITNTVSAFLSRRTVTYNWTVEPTQIEDRYKVTIETTFETNVPLPVLTMTPNVIDLAEITADETIVNVTITNEGLLATNDANLSYPTHPKWEFTPLVTDIGVLPAKSSITIPVRIRKIPLNQVSGRSNVARSNGGGGACSTGASVCATIFCGDLPIQICGSQALTNADTGCGFAPQPGDGGGGGGPFGGSSSSGASVKLACDLSDVGICLVKNGLGCILPPWALINCSYNTFQCLEEFQENKLTPRNFTSCTIGYFGCLYKRLNTFSCIYSLVDCVIPDPAASTNNRSSRSELSARESVGVDPIDAFRPGVRAMIDAFDEITGSAGASWLQDSGPDLGSWYQRFQAYTTLGSDGQELLTSSERLELLGGVMPPNIDEIEINRFMDRWNRTQINYERGIVRRADTPAGESSDFIDVDKLAEAMARFSDSQDLAIRSGFSDPFEAIAATAHARQDAGEGGGVCGRVKLNLEQEAVLTRDAFRATLDIDNNGEPSLENIRVNITLQPESGGDASDLFDIRYEGANGLTNVDGAGVLAGESSGSARWQIIPTVDAAPTEPVRYLVSGRLTYTLDGVEVSLPFSPVTITVLPTPRLTLKYFHQRDVFSDDPFTDVVEPAIPYSLAVMVQNNGAGEARNFSITSAQPKIIDNEKGLLVDFQIITTHVAGHPLQPSLAANFGNIDPGQIKIGEWLMTSSLQGLFIDYAATVEHLDGRGNPRLSLIDSVEIHEMNHQVRALGTLDDGAPDFLVNDVPDIRDLPDTIYLSDGTTASVAVVEAAQANGTLTKTLTATMPAGWNYLRVPEPSNGQLDLIRVVRSDGLEIPLDVNAWVTDRTFIGQGKRPMYENILHLLDHDSTGSYTLTYRAKLAPDTQLPVSRVTALAANSPLEFPVNWEGSDDRRVAFYDVYVSTDGGPYALWLQRSQDTGAIFQGETGRSYAFYSRATDPTGNVEAAPSAADASTQVTLNNIAPALAAISAQQVTEGETFTLNLAGSDPDGRSDLLTYSITSQVPPGVTLDSNTGRIRWATGEADGGRQVSVEVKVTDAGTPAQSATRSFVIAVLEENKPPELANVDPQRVAMNDTLTVALQGQDTDLPAQMLTYRFTSPPPAGMTLNENTGLVAWQPTISQADQTLVVSVAVTDSGNPPKEAQRTFPVTVEPAQLNRAPQFLAAPLQVWLAGTVRTLAVAAFDPDGDAVTMMLNKAGLPGILSFASTPGTGRGIITWNTTGVAPGIYSLPVVATAASLNSIYSHRVEILPSNIANLRDLRLSVGNIQPAFASGTTAYTIAVPNNVASTKVTPSVMDSSATVKVNSTTDASGAASASIPLSVGNNTITVKVTAQDGVTEKTYTVTVIRAPSNIANLNALALSAGSINPTFAAETTAYTLTVANRIASTIVTPSVMDSTSTVKVNGLVVTSETASASIPLKVGANLITVEVTAQDGTTKKSYKITVARRGSSVATLSNLAISRGNLSPAFNSSTFDYSARVPNTTASITVTPTKSNTNSTIRVNNTLVDSGTVSSAIPLRVGINTIIVEVTAQDGLTKRIYALKIKREMSSVKDLRRLVVDGAKLSPKFRSSIKTYKVEVEPTKKTIQLMAWARHPKAKISINEVVVKSGNPSKPIILKTFGNTSIPIIVTAQDGSKKTYRVIFVRKK
jgi:hypothetical protein